MQLNPLQTLALGGLVLLAGEWLRRAVPPLARYNVPGPVIGGLAISLLALAVRHWDLATLEFDDALREPLQNAFFSTIGFGASYTLLKRGGPLVAGLLALTVIGAVLQNVVGAALARMMGQPALLGVLCGSVTLTGGPATGLAFAPDFAKAGVAGADAIALAAAMGGIVAAGAIGAPLGTFLIERRRRREAPAEPGAVGAAEFADALKSPIAAPTTAGDERGFFALIKGAAFILFAMWLGAGIGAWLTAHHIKLPSYIGGMIVAAVIRNLDDATGWFAAPQRAIDDLGGVALAFFLALALMMLDLRQLSAVAVPLAVILGVQIVLMAALCAWPVYPLLGRNYDGAVITSGFFGFMIGTTPVSVANMDSLVRRYAPSPQAFLVVPIVGAFLLDFINALLIQGSLNLFS